MNPKIKNILFFLIVFTLISTHIPRWLSMGFLGGPVGNKLVFYPLFAGISYTVYCQWKYKNVLAHRDIVLKYLSVYLGVTFLSLIIGLYNFPYYDLIMQGPPEQIEKLPRVLAFLNSYGVDITHKQLLSFWLFARPIKGLFLDAFWTVGTVYMIYCWYREDWRQGFNVLCKGVLASAILIIFHGIVEVSYLAGNADAKKLLMTITPWHLSIEPGVGFGQLLPWKATRSVFDEPSFFGIYASFALPFLWYQLTCWKNFSEYKRRLLVFGVIVSAISFLLFLTKARTTSAVIFIELILLAGMFCYLRNFANFKKFISIILCTAIGFAGCNYFISEYINVSRQAKVISSSAGKYIDENLLTIASEKKRSNSARYAYIKSAFRVGLEHPILGVGKGLHSFYMMNKFTDEELKVGEIKRRFSDVKKYGALKRQFPTVCEYTEKFAGIGILGLASYMAPILLLLFKLLQNLKLGSEYVIVLLSLLGLLASGFSAPFYSNHAYWVLIGLGYAMCFGESKGELKYL